MKTTHHFCLCLEGALRNWVPSEWKTTARENGLTVPQLKKTFEIYRFEGKRVIPIGDKCEGFSYETGCPGHPSEDSA